MDVYPLFLIGLTERRCVVIGGDQEAERKVEGLLEAAAVVTVISPCLTVSLQARARTTTVAWLPRDYEPGDLQGAFLVIVTTRDAEMRSRVWQEAQTVKALINVVDDPSRSTFIVGSVVRQGGLTLAISTSGSAPALAVRLRQRFEQEFGPEYAVFLDLMRELRAPLATRCPDFEVRRARWYALIDSPILDLLREGRTAEARQHAMTIVDGV